jgi:hypothetical protein
LGREYATGDVDDGPGQKEETAVMDYDLAQIAKRLFADFNGQIPSPP